MSKAGAKFIPCLFLLLAMPVFAGGTADLDGLLAAGRADELIQDANKRLETSPRDADAYLALCRTNMALESWEQATGACEQAVSISPQNSVFHMWLGRSYGERAGHANFLSAISWAKKAVAEFQKAVQLDPSNAPARGDLIEYQIDAPGFLGGGVSKAKTEAEKLQSLDSALAHFLKSRIAEKEKDYDSAERELRQAIAASKEPARDWINLATFYERRKRFPQMLDALNHALAVPQGQTSAIFYAAEILLRTGQDLQRAAQLTREYLNGTPDEEVPLFRAHYLMGNILEKQGRSDLAAGEYKAALEHAHTFELARQKLSQLQK